MKSPIEEMEQAAQEAKARVLANLRILTDQVERGEVVSLAISYIHKRENAMGQLLWTETQLALFELIAAVEVSKFDILRVYSMTAYREVPGLSVVPTKGDHSDGK